MTFRALKRPGRGDELIKATVTGSSEASGFREICRWLARLGGLKYEKAYRRRLNFGAKFTSRNESRTKPARIADSIFTLISFLRILVEGMGKPWLQGGRDRDGCVKIGRLQSAGRFTNRSVPEQRIDESAFCAVSLCVRRQMSWPQAPRGASLPRGEAAERCPALRVVCHPRTNSETCRKAARPAGVKALRRCIMGLSLTQTHAIPIENRFRNRRSAQLPRPRLAAVR